MFGAGGEGPGAGANGELVLEVLVRGGGEGRRRAVERTLEGWAGEKGGPVDLASLSSLKSLWTRKVVDEVRSFSLYGKTQVFTTFFRQHQQTLHRMYHLTSTSHRHK